MGNVARSLTLLVLVAPLTGLAQSSASGSKVYQLAAPSVVTIVVSEGAARRQGSGVVFESVEAQPATSYQDRSEPLSNVVTNAHVVGKSKTVQISAAGRVYSADVVGVDDELDLALLVVEGACLPKARRGSSSSPPAIGSTVFAIGSPLGLDRTITPGLVSSIRDVDGVTMLQISAAISPGSSGGGLFNESGELVGITASRLPEGEAIGFAVSSLHIRELQDAGLAAGLLRIFVIEGSAYAGREKLQGNSLLKWLRKTKVADERAVSSTVLESIKKYNGARSRKDSTAASAEMRRLKEIIDWFLEDATATGVPEKVTEDLILECVMIGDDGHQIGQPFILEVDFTATKVNGYPAQISDGEISWQREGIPTRYGSQKRAYLTLSRFSGLLTARTKNAQGAFMTGEIPSGRCTPRTKKQF